MTDNRFPRYVVFGEALTDMIRQDDGTWHSHPGGSCWNVARVGARLGLHTGYAGAVSNDAFGDEIAAASGQAGLDERFLQRADAPPFIAMVTSRHPPRYVFLGENSADLHFQPARLPEGWIDAAEVIHLGSLALAREPLAQRLVEQAVLARRAGRRIAFDPNFRNEMRDPAYRPVFQQVAAIASYIKVSDEDLEGLFPGRSPGDALAELRALAPDAEILLTRGADGLTLFSGERVLEAPARRVAVVDTVGCGDASMAGWISGMLLHPDLPAPRQLARIAAVAAVAAMHAGPYAPSAQEADALLD
ncbi:carbohydrate kinase family protein [Pseudoduganella albidiflava]|uniref:Carbohydrate kinase n=1 Tax=Pseudoduganella albidiflava TaxID=321983 RepID=A0A411WX39_9BURK|nr:carbohydrate kinase [Pseudoduganella albidiflava]QBI01229.1 carbohydrate kinase [Pseudoduganella albidiflava]GGY49195.1 fructokinase [Pseudoduganella albidiflava]